VEISDLKRQVLGFGPMGGILLIGEAPAKDEIKEGRPFVGRAGHLLRSCLWQAGIPDNSIRYENVFEREIFKHEKSSFYSGMIPSIELSLWHEDLHRRVMVAEPKVIIAAGDFALKASTNEKGSITSVHCHICKDRWGIGISVIPVIHPSAFQHNGALNPFWLVHGLRKAETVFRNGLKERNDLIYSIRLDDGEFECEQRKKLREICEGRDVLAVDIETAQGTISSISLASSVGAIVVEQPLMSPLWLFIVIYLEDKNVMKVFHNFIFDCMWLWKVGVRVRNINDTLAMSHCLAPEFERSLNDIVRMHLFVRPWKDRRDGLDIYNALDSIYTLECFNQQTNLLMNQKLFDFYEKFTHSLFEPLLDICTHGIRFDKAKQRKKRLEARTEQRTLKKTAKKTLQNNGIILQKTELSPAKKKLIEHVRKLGLSQILTLLCSDKSLDLGTVETFKDILLPYTPKRVVNLSQKTTKITQIPLNLKSPTQIMTILKKMKLKIPTVKTSKGIRKESTNAKALAKLEQRYPENEFIQLLKRYRKLVKFIDNYLKARIDPDGRFRFQLGFAGTDKDDADGTKTSRFSSSGTPWGTGANIQNMPRKGFRDCFLADINEVFVQVDWRQIEAVLVAMLSQDVQLLKWLDEGADFHKITASLLYDIPVEKVTKAERDPSKSIRHGFNYDMGPFTLSECMLTQGLVISTTKAKQLLEKMNTVSPAVVRWHRSTQEFLEKNRFLVTPHGRIRRFTRQLKTKKGNEWVFNENVAREAYNYLPQTITGDMTNLALVELWKRGFRISNQVHDSLLFTVSRQKLEELLSAIDSVFGEVGIITINGLTKKVGYDVTIGLDWGDMVSLEKWKEKCD